MNPSGDRCLALSGVFQAAFLVQQLARVGEVQPVYLQTSLDSVLQLDITTVEGIFAGTSGLRFGLNKLADLQIGRASQGTVEAMRYVLLLLLLADHLAADPEAVQALTGALKRLVAKRQAPAEERAEEQSVSQLIEDLADLYTRHLSKIKPGIVVHGERSLLHEQAIIDTVRACLLAGVRAAWLWYQLGGKRWHLLFYRGRYIRQAGDILVNQPADIT